MNNNSDTQKLNKAKDTHMSPRYKLGHTSSPWRQERGAECKTSSSSWRDEISHFLFESSVLFFSSSGSVSLIFLRSESRVSHLTSETAPLIGFLSVISKFRGGKLLCYSPNTKSRCCLLPLLWLLAVLTVRNRWCSLAQTLSQTLSHRNVFILVWKPLSVLFK